MAHGQIRIASDAAGESERSIEQLAGRHHFFNETNTQRFFGIDDLAGKNQTHGAADADQLGQIAGAAAFRHEARRYGHFAEARAGRRDAHVAERRHLESDAHGGAVDGGDRHLRQIFELAHGALQDSVAQVIEKILGHFLVRAADSHGAFEGAEHFAFRREIAAGAETPPFPGQNHNLDHGVTRDLVTQGIELEAHERIDSVELFGTIQRDNPNARLAGIARVVAHRPFECFVIHLGLLEQT